jgi:hypothetical protein
VNDRPNASPSYTVLLRANPWWNQALTVAAGDASKLVPLRDLGAWLAESPLWSLAPGGRTLQGGRLGLAILLDSAWRHAPQAYAVLLDTLASWRRVDDVAVVKRLWLATMAVHAGWCRSLGEPTTPVFGVMQTLATLNDRIPFDPRAASDDDGAVRAAAAYINDYAKGTSHLQRYALGAWHAGRWSTKDIEARRLARVGIVPANLFRDLVALTVNSAWAMVGVFAMSEAPREPPDPVVFDLLRVAPLPMPAARASLTTLNTLAAATTGTTGDAAPTGGTDAGVPDDEKWWAACKAWATTPGRSLGRLLDLAAAMETRPMWPLVATHLQTLAQSVAWRAQQRGRLVLGVVIDEFRRAFPQDVALFLDTLAPPDDVVLTLEHCGNFQAQYDAVYDVWARTLRTEHAPHETPTAKVLNQMGSIVPWDDLKGQDQAAREQKQTAAIDRAYGNRQVTAAADFSDTRRSSQTPSEPRRPTEPYREYGAGRPTKVQPGFGRASGSMESVAAVSSTELWTGVYWAGVHVRNDTVHNNPQRLLNRVRPVDLRLDLLLFHGLAALRFLSQLANRGPSKVTMPCVTCMA